MWNHFLLYHKDTMLVILRLVNLEYVNPQHNVSGNSYTLSSKYSPLLIILEWEPQFGDQSLNNHYFFISFSAIRII